jgi:hypothetical protein
MHMTDQASPPDRSGLNQPSIDYFKIIFRFEDVREQSRPRHTTDQALAHVCRSSDLATCQIRPGHTPDQALADNRSDLAERETRPCHRTVQVLIHDKAGHAHVIYQVLLPTNQAMSYDSSDHTTRSIRTCHLIDQVLLTRQMRPCHLKCLCCLSGASPGHCAVPGGNPRN